MLKTIFGELNEKEIKALRIFASYKEGLVMPFSVIDRDIFEAAHSLKDKDLLIIEPVDAMNFTDGNDQFVFKLYKWARHKLDESELIVKIAIRVS